MSTPSHGTPKILNLPGIPKDLAQSVTAMSITRPRKKTIVVMLSAIPALIGLYVVRIKVSVGLLGYPESISVTDGSSRLASLAPDWKPLPLERLQVTRAARTWSPTEVSNELFSLEDSSPSFADISAIRSTVSDASLAVTSGTTSSGLNPWTLPQSQESIPSWFKPDLTQGGWWMQFDHRDSRIAIFGSGSGGMLYLVAFY